MKIFKSMMDAVKKSINDHLGKTSSTRISAYLILSLISLNVVVFMVIDVVNASIKWSQGETYTIPTESIWIFGLLLSHHLGLLFHKKKEFSGKNTFIAESNAEDVRPKVPTLDDNEYGAMDNEEEG